MSERRAYVCLSDAKTREIHRRVFLTAGEPVPRCPLHGRMVRQPNAIYRAKDPRPADVRRTDG